MGNCSGEFDLVVTRYLPSVFFVTVKYAFSPLVTVTINGPLRVPLRGFLILGGGGGGGGGKQGN